MNSISLKLIFLEIPHKKIDVLVCDLRGWVSKQYLNTLLGEIRNLECIT